MIDQSLKSDGVKKTVDRFVLEATYLHLILFQDAVNF